MKRKMLALSMALLLAGSAGNYTQMVFAQETSGAALTEQTEPQISGKEEAAQEDRLEKGKKEDQKLIEKEAVTELDLAKSDVVIEDGEVSYGGEVVSIAPIIITGESEKHSVTVNGDAEIILKDVDLQTTEEKSLIDLQSGNVKLTLEGNNRITNTAGGEKAAIRVSSNTELTVDGEGKLDIQFGSHESGKQAYGSSIGGNFQESPKAIYVNGGETKIVQDGTSAAIGGGAQADSGDVNIAGGNISIEVYGVGVAGTGIGGGSEGYKGSSHIGTAGSADVSITGGNVEVLVKPDAVQESGAAIGSGQSEGGSIYIGGSAAVKADTWVQSAAIGSGSGVTGGIGDNIDPPQNDPGTIVIEGNAKVTAATHSPDYYGEPYCAGAAIGSGGFNHQKWNISIKGNADVTANAGWYGSGIGGAYEQPSYGVDTQPVEILITEDAVVNASSAGFGAGIGGGYCAGKPVLSDVTISGKADVTAKGGAGGYDLSGGAGIGAGNGGIPGNIVITDSAKVKAYGGQNAAGIGGGCAGEQGSQAGSITISKNAKVEAYGDELAAGIGGGAVWDGVHDNSEENPGSAGTISILDSVSVKAVGGRGASAIGGAADYHGVIPSGGSITITEGVQIEAYADGEKYAVDLNVDQLDIKNSLLNARFAEGANLSGQEKDFQILLDGNVDHKMTMPSDYRSFAGSVSIAEGENRQVRVQDAEPQRSQYFAFYKEDGMRKIQYPIQPGEMLVKDELDWKADVSTMTLADMVIYMGGENGYDGIVNEDGTIQGNTDSLPEPGFSFALPDEVEKALKEQEGVSDEKALDLSKYVTIKAGTKQWSLELYGEAGESDLGGKNIYRIVPAEGQDPVRIQLTDEEGNVHVSDEFQIKDALFSEYTMEIYTGAVNPQDVILEVAGIAEIPLETKGSNLTVRGVTVEGTTTPVQTEPVSEKVEKPTAVVDKNAEFTINDSNIKVREGKISLLSDPVMDINGSRNLLAERTKEILGVSGKSRGYEMIYLDLVDADNGNIWVSSSKEVTVYLPYPEGTDESTKFNLVHFEGLDRDMSVADLKDQIAACDTETIKVENTQYGVAFKTKSFSPFVLTWEQKAGGTGSGTGERNESVKTGDESSLWLWAAVMTAALAAAGIVAGKRYRKR